MIKMSQDGLLMQDRLASARTFLTQFCRTKVKSVCVSACSLYDWMVIVTGTHYVGPSNDVAKKPESHPSLDVDNIYY